MVARHQYVLLFFTVVLTVYHANAAITSTVSNGTWSDAAIWSAGRVPSSADSVYIRHFVHLDAHLTMNSPGYLYVDTSGVICGHYDMYINWGYVYNRGVIRIDSMDLRGTYYTRDGQGFLQTTRGARVSGTGSIMSYNTGCWIITGQNFDCDNFVQFAASDTAICGGDCIDFNIHGEELVLKVMPTRYWYFPGTSSSFSNLSSPAHICYDSSGVYDVTLATRYGNCRIWHTVTRRMYIDVGLQRTAIIGLAPVYCASDLPVVLTGVPPGGVFSGPGIDGNIFLPKDAETGNNVITYQVENGCTDSAQQTVTIFEQPCEALGVTDRALNNVKVYPNPFTRRILIDVDSKFGDNISIKLLDLPGRVIYDEHRVLKHGENTLAIEVESEISNGMYFLELVSKSSASHPLHFALHKQ